MWREFGDLQNLPQDLWPFDRFCGPQTFFTWDLDSIQKLFFLHHSISLLSLLNPNLLVNEQTSTNFGLQFEEVVTAEEDEIFC